MCVFVFGVYVHVCAYVGMCTLVCVCMCVAVSVCVYTRLLLSHKHHCPLAELLKHLSFSQLNIKLSRMNDLIRCAVFSPTLLILT